MRPSNTKHQEFAPPQELNDIIKCFWYNDSNFGKEETNFEVIPDGYAEIIFHFGNGCSILQDGILQKLPSPFLVGLLDQPVHFHTKGRLQILAIRCFPWTVFDLLNLNSNKNNVHTFEHPIAKLHTILYDYIKNDNTEKAINHLKEYFSQAPISTESLLYKAGIAMRKPMEQCLSIKSQT